MTKAVSLMAQERAKECEDLIDGLTAMVALGHWSYVEKYGWRIWKCELGEGETKIKVYYFVDRQELLIRRRGETPTERWSLVCRTRPEYIDESMGLLHEALTGEPCQHRLLMDALTAIEELLP